MNPQNLSLKIIYFFNILVSFTANSQAKLNEELCLPPTPPHPPSLRSGVILQVTTILNLRLIQNDSI